METGKPGLASAPMHISLVTTQAENRMDNQAPLMAVYIRTLPTLSAQPYHQMPAPVCKPATLHLAVPSLYSKESIPFLPLHFAAEQQSQPGLSTAGAAASSVRPKSAGKYVCPHCARDCMKPSVLEKHLRCHTGERPYPCTTCGVSFKTQSNLYKHRRTQAHIRNSSVSEHSSISSLDNSLREACPSSLSLDECSEESGHVDKDSGLPGIEIMRTKCLTKFIPQGTVGELCNMNLDGYSKKQNENKNTMNEDENLKVDSNGPTPPVSRHVPLQRQEATLFSKQWESGLSRGKSQSHESTDSGFSESTDHYLSPSSVLPEQSQCSPSGPSMETISSTACVETALNEIELKDTVRNLEQKTLEEHISRLISENTIVVEDKQLENIRPRKTVLSKQGSIDLPMPYTYKDSFHFEMRAGHTSGSNLNSRPAVYCSVPTQCSSRVEHVPLTRSTSLPFSVTLRQPEKSNLNLVSSHHTDYVTLVRRGSSDQVNTETFAIRPMNQHLSTHYPLVRQTAVDCNHAADALFMNSSVEEVSVGFSSDLDAAKICGEQRSKKLRRKKAQKFAYNKWYTYGGGTFKKLYSPEKSRENSSIKVGKYSENTEQSGLKRLTTSQKETGTGSASVVSSPNISSSLCPLYSPPTSLPTISTLDRIQQTMCAMAPLRRNLSLSVLPSLSPDSQETESVNRTEASMLVQEHSGLTSQLSVLHIPSNRKKQRTDCELMCTLVVDSNQITMASSPASVPDRTPKQGTNISCSNLNKTSRVSGTSTLSTMSTATQYKFLPKYQLKLPNTSETVSTLPPHLEEKLSAHSTSTMSHSQGEQASGAIYALSYSKCGVSPVKATHHQPLLLSKVTRLCQNLTSSLAVSHRQFASTTKTTSCLQNHQGGLCNTSVPSTPESGSRAMQIPPTAPHTTPCTLPPALPAAHTTFPPEVTTTLAECTTSLFPHFDPHAVVTICPTALKTPPVALTTPPPALTTPHSLVFASSAAHTIPPALPTVPPVAHTPSPAEHTAPPAVLTTSTGALTVTGANSKTPAGDTTSAQLPHCASSPNLSQVSIESDFLTSALRPAGPKTPVVHCQVVPLDQVQLSPQRVFHVHTADLQICLQIISDEQLALIEPQIERPSGLGCSTQNVGNQVQSFVNTDRTIHVRHGQKLMDNSGHLLRKTRPLSVHFGNPNLDQDSVSTWAPISAAPAIPLETVSPQLHPHHYTLVNMETRNSVGYLMSTDTSARDVRSEKRQTSEETQNCHSDVLVEPKAGGSMSCQHKVHGSTVFPHSLDQNNISVTKSEVLDRVLKPEIERELLKTEFEGLVPRNAQLEGEKYRQMPQRGQELIACSSPLEPIFSQPPFKQENVSCDKVGPLNYSSFESQDVIESVFSEKGQSTFESSNLEKPEALLDVYSTPHNSSTGLLEETTHRLRETMDWCIDQNRGGPHGGLGEQGRTRGTTKDHLPRPRCKLKSDYRSLDDTMGANRAIATITQLPQQYLLSQTVSEMTPALAAASRRSIRSSSKTMVCEQYQTQETRKPHEAQGCRAMAQTLQLCQPMEVLSTPQSGQNFNQDLSQDKNSDLGQNMSQDSSSSDDEGKLIIEL